MKKNLMMKIIINQRKEIEVAVEVKVPQRKRKKKKLSKKLNSSEKD